MNEESWGEMAALSRRMARIEIALTERILSLEAEVKALSSRSDAGQAQPARTVYEDARIIEWREDGAAQDAIDGIMQR